MTDGGEVYNRGMNENRKTRLCTKFFQYGQCLYADKCNFAHGVHELVNMPGSMMMSIPGTMMMMQDLNLNANGPHPASARTNYKTRELPETTGIARMQSMHRLHAIDNGTMTSSL